MAIKEDKAMKDEKNGDRFNVEVVRTSVIPVVVSLDGGCELEMSSVVWSKRDREEGEEENLPKRARDEEENSEEMPNVFLNTSDSVPGSSDTLTPEDGDEVANLYDTEDDTDQEDEEGPLSGYLLVNRFPDLDFHLVEPDSDWDRPSDQHIPTTSEPDLVLYSDRTSSDSIMPVCRCARDFQARDTGFAYWEVED